MVDARVAELGDCLRQQPSHPVVVVDLSDTVGADGGGVGIVLAAGARLQEEGGRMVVVVNDPVLAEALYALGQGVRRRLTATATIDIRVVAQIAVLAPLLVCVVTCSGPRRTRCPYPGGRDSWSSGGSDWDDPPAGNRPDVDLQQEVFRTGPRHHRTGPSRAGVGGDVARLAPDDDAPSGFSLAVYRVHLEHSLPREHAGRLATGVGAEQDSVSLDGIVHREDLDLTVHVCHHPADDLGCEELPAVCLTEDFGSSEQIDCSHLCSSPSTVSMLDRNGIIRDIVRGWQVRKSLMAGAPFDRPLRVGPAVTFGSNALGGAVVWSDPLPVRPSVSHSQRESTTLSAPVSPARLKTS